jgi:hypothetical protein
MSPYNEGDPEHLGDIMSIPLQGGARRVIVRNLSFGNLLCARMPSKLCFLGEMTGSSERILSFDPQKGTTQEFGTFPIVQSLGLSLSPDGSQLAVLPIPGSTITFMTVRDKSTYTVELQGLAKPITIDWTGDGRSVYVVAQTSNGTDEVVEVEPSGKSHVVLENDNHTHLWWAIQSPDGRHALIQEVAGENNVWVVDNF